MVKLRWLWLNPRLLSNNLKEVISSSNTYFLMEWAAMTWLVKIFISIFWSNSLLRILDLLKWSKKASIVERMLTKFLPMRNLPSIMFLKILLLYMPMLPLLLNSTPPKPLLRIPLLLTKFWSYCSSPYSYSWMNLLYKFSKFWTFMS